MDKHRCSTVKIQPPEITIDRFILLAGNLEGNYGEFHSPYGAHAELMRRTDGEIVVIVRASSPIDASVMLRKAEEKISNLEEWGRDD